MPVWLALAVVLPVVSADRYLLGADSGHYVELAGALSHGEPYQVNGRPEVKYPPGFPLLLAPAGLVARNDFGVASAWAAFLASFVFLVAVGWAVRERSEFPVALGIVTVTSATFILLATGNPMADVAFMGVSLGFLLWGAGWYASPAPLGWRSALAGGGLLAATVAIRTAGIAAVAAYGLAVVVRAVVRRPGWRATARDLLPLVPAAVFLGAWVWWTTTMRQPWYTGEYMDSYVHQLVLRSPHEPALGRASLADLVVRAVSGLRTQAAHAGELLTQLPSVEARWFSPLVALPILLVLAGMVREVRRGGVLTPAYVVAYLGVVVLWPFDEGRRFLLPILPLLVVYASGGAAAVLEAVRAGRRGVPRWQLTVGVLGLAVAVATLGPRPHNLSTQDALSVAGWAAILAAAPFTARRAAAGLAQALWRRRPVLVGILVLVFAAAGIARTAPVLATRARSGAPDNPTARALDHAAAWLHDNTNPAAVVQATFVSQLHIASRRRVVPLPIVTDPAVYREIDRRHAPHYLVVLAPTRYEYYRPTDPERLVVLRQALGVELRQVYDFPGATLYAFPRRTGAGRARGP